MKLDRNKPFGIITGTHHASFEQDGLLFDALGNEITDSVEQINEVSTNPVEIEPVPEEDVMPELKKRGRPAKVDDVI